MTFVAIGALRVKSLQNGYFASFFVVCKLKKNYTRAYPGSEFVVATTLAKWKKLEPNEIDLSQGFVRK